MRFAINRRQLKFLLLSIGVAVVTMQVSVAVEVPPETRANTFGVLLPEDQIPKNEPVKAEGPTATTAIAEEQSESTSRPEVKPDPTPAPHTGKPVNLCFFSFNNPHEVTTAKTFVRRITRFPGAPKISVSEYQVFDSDPEDSVKASAAKGRHCDGLVLSGHHNDSGEFWGERADSDLEIEFLEELSSIKRYAPWFANVKVLWLQGCHTSSTDLYNPDVDSDDRVRGSPLRVIRNGLDPSDMEDSIDDLNDRFLENVNEDNIVNVYARLFPSATVFTWKEKAPGEKAGSHWSLPFHIAQTSYVIDPSERYFQSPLSAKTSATASVRFAQILWEMMTHPAYPAKHSGALASDEKIYIKGWRDHGRAGYHKRRWAFDNPSTVAFKSVDSSDNEVLRQTKVMTALLEYYDRTEATSTTATVNYLLNTEGMAENAVYLLYALYLNSGKSKGLAAKMSANKPLMTTLRRVANTPSVAQWRRRDYQKFLTLLGG